MKKYISLMLISCLIIGVLTGCGKTSTQTNYPKITPPVLETPNIKNPSNTIEPDTKVTTDTPIETIKSENNKEKTAIRKDSQEFNESLIEYLKANGYENQNFMVSPVSLRAAMCLLTMGAKNETQEVLLNSIGFKNTESMINWYNDILGSVADFEELVEKEKENREKDFLRDYRLKNIEELTESEDEEYKMELLPVYEKYMDIGWGYNLANSVWVNKDKEVNLTNKYIKTVERYFDATARNEKYSDIDEAVDKWVYEKTNGYIPTLGLQLYNTPITLINTVYLKSPWEFDFYKSNKINTFRKYDDGKVDKNYIECTDYMEYYRDNDTTLTVVPLQNGLNVVFIMGDDSDLNKKLDKTTRKYINLIMPEFEISNKFENGLLKNYFIDNGFSLPFTLNADFGEMVTNSLIQIDDIIQITKIGVDEDGLEAAAVTVLTEDGAMAGNTKEPIRVIYDVSYSFYIIDSNNNNEVLFYGQIVE